MRALSVLKKVAWKEKPSPGEKVARPNEVRKKRVGRGMRAEIYDIAKCKGLLKGWFLNDTCEEV